MKSYGFSVVKFWAVLVDKDCIVDNVFKERKGKCKVNVKAFTLCKVLICKELHKSVKLLVEFYYTLRFVVQSHIRSKQLWLRELRHLAWSGTRTAL